MIEINFKHITGPRKDGTSDFEVTFPNGLCFGDFLMWIHKESSFEDAYSWYGEIFRRVGDNDITKLLHYKNGKIVFDESYSGFDATTFYNAIFTKPIKKIISEGGFGRMDYIIWFDDKPGA